MEPKTLIDPEEQMKASLDEQLHEVNRDEAEAFRPQPLYTMDRQERRNRLKYFKKEFQKHVKRKPKVNVNEEDPEKQAEGIMRMQRWATRYAILARKIQELHEFKRDNTGVRQPDAQESTATGQGESGTGDETTDSL